MLESSKPKGLPTLAVEFKDLVVTYAKQETIEPIKSLGRFIGWGVAGAMVLANGLILLVLALLRALQTETGDAFDGNLSFAPYLVTVVVCAIVLVMALRAVGAAKRRKTART
ncbi:MAG: phage holin family protein [Actinobacteria bacterium]|nr:phage holin family protein [Actinomycetota bacterium]